jgi:WD40 repeat protein
VYQIQDSSLAGHPAPGTQVELNDVIVTAIDAMGSNQGIWVQERQGGPYSGIFVFKPDGLAVNLNNFAEGDLVTVTGTYKEYYDLSEIELGTITRTGSQTPLQAQLVSDLQNQPEPWEGVLVEVCGDCQVTALLDHGEAQTSCGRIDDGIYDYTVSVGMSCTCIRGLWHYSFDNYKLLPRNSLDLAGCKQESYTVTLNEIEEYIDPFNDPYLTSVTSLQWHPIENWLLQGGNQMGSFGGDELHFSAGRIVIWDMSGANPLASDVHELGPLTTVGWNSGGTKIATGTHGSGNVLVYSVSSNLEIANVYENGTCHDGDVNKLVWSPDKEVFYSVGGAVFSPGAAPEICRYEFGNSTFDYTKHGSTSVYAYRDIAVSQDGTEIYVAQEESITVRAENNFSLHNGIALDPSHFYTLIDLMENGQIAAVTEKSVFFLNPYFDHSNPATNGLSGALFEDNITAIRAHPSLPLLAVGTDTGFLAIVSQEDGRKLATVQAHDGPIYALEWTPDGKLFSGGLHPALKSWSVQVTSE